MRLFVLLACLFLAGPARALKLDESALQRAADSVGTGLSPAAAPPSVIGHQFSKPDDTANKYEVDRCLRHYIYLFGLRNDLQGELSKLGPGRQWIDVGAGKGVAAMDYIEDTDGHGLYHGARVTAITVERLETPRLSQVLRRFSPEKFRYLSGKYIEDYTVSELGQADLITDVYGAVSYSPHIDAVFSKFGELLKAGGKVYTNIEGPDFLLEIMGPDNQPIPLAEWLGAIKGFTLLFKTNEYFDRIILQKTSDAVVVPPLELVKYVDAVPPRRVYRWNRSGWGRLKLQGLDLK